MSRLNVRLAAYLHCRTSTRILTRILTPNPMTTLYYAETVPIAWTLTWILIRIWILNDYWMDIHIQIGIQVRVRQCK